MIKKYLEVKGYKYIGIEILVKIDYEKGNISFVESIPHGIFIEPNYRFVDKKWLFANRGLEYMAGWKDILQAMEYAIDQASKELKSYNDEVEKYKAGEICQMMDIASEIIKGQNKNKKGKNNGKNK